MARSLDFLGTILKVVAETPDANDLEKITFKEQQLIDLNNKQIEHNTKVQKNLNLKHGEKVAI